MNIKNERIAGIIKKEVSDIIQFSLKDKQIGFCTVTDVTVTKDLSFAKIFVSFLDKPQYVNERLSSLKHAKGFIRTELGKRMKTYKVPDLIFTIDDSLEKGNKIDRIIKDINK